MNLPATVTLNGKKYEVREGRIKDYGKCSTGTRTIIVRKKQSDRDKAKTAFHEFLHLKLWMLDEACILDLEDELWDAMEDCGII